tara:strand:+ start:1135 stop:1704 length:570 start_codon:yes stop_codon:yes gene_type:complete
MSINVLVGDTAIKKSGTKLKDYKFSLDIRQTLGGDYVIYDHHDIDIVVMPNMKKIVSFPKDKISDLTYDTQSRLFDYLTKKGIIARDSVQGGNVYASIQGLLEQPKKPKDGDPLDPIQAAIFGVAKFIEEERPRYEYLQKMEEEEEDYYTQASEENSTGLGEVPHSREKGSIRPGIYYQSYMHNRFYRR